RIGATDLFEIIILEIVVASQLSFGVAHCFQATGTLLIAVLDKGVVRITLGRRSALRIPIPRRSIPIRINNCLQRPASAPVKLCQSPQSILHGCDFAQWVVIRPAPAAE